jgi:hypothetical protein
MVLRGEAAAASIFPNTTDIGICREAVYAEFLRQHAPSKCNVFLGGYVFGNDGSESPQMDVIITTDTAPRFAFKNQGKSFAPVNGTLAVASIKSTLDKRELFSALNGLAAIPPVTALSKWQLVPGASIPDYEDWPHKIVYASDGIAIETLLSHLSEYYQANGHVPVSRRPNLIHVLGKYAVFRAGKQGVQSRHLETGNTTKIEPDLLYSQGGHFDVTAIAQVVQALQQKATASTFVAFDYASVFRGMHVSPYATGAK